MIRNEMRREFPAVSFVKRRRKCPRDTNIICGRTSCFVKDIRRNTIRTMFESETEGWESHHFKIHAAVLYIPKIIWKRKHLCLAVVYT